MTPQELVIDIVRKNVSPVQEVGNPEIVQAARTLMRSRKEWGTNALMIFCEAYLKSYHNSNYDSTTNGEHRLLKQLAALAPKVVFDVGANEGQWSLAAHKFLRFATIHAFEIVPATHQKMTGNIAGHDRIIGHNFGLSDSDGVVEVNVYPGSTELSSLLDCSHGVPTKLPCDVKRADNYIASRGIEHIDFLKIDTEGAEPLVLNGFGDYLSGGFIDVIQFEYGMLNVRTGFSLKDFNHLLHSRGFIFGKLYSDGVEYKDYANETDVFPGPNYVAVSNQRPDLIEKLRA